MDLEEARKIVSAYGGFIECARWRHIRSFMRFLGNVGRKYPGAKISIIAHGYGAEVCFQAIKASGEK